MTVTIDELAGSPRGSYSNGRYTITRRVVVAWDDIDAYSQELVPIASSSGTATTRQPPAAYPANSAFRVSEFDWEPFFGENEGITGQSNDGILKYTNAVFTIKYEVPQSAQTDVEQLQAQELTVDPVLFLTHQFDSGGQVLRLATGAYEWALSGEPLPEDIAPGIVYPTTQHTIHWPSVVNPNWEALEGQKGTVNDAAFTLRGYPYPEDTLLYLGYSGQQEVMSDGTRAWSLSLKFEAKTAGGDKTKGHSYFYNPDEKDFRLIWEIGTHKYPYRASDFNLLFAGGS